MKISTISSITKSENFCKQFFNDISPFISFDFFEKLELSGSTNFNSGWIPEHLILEEKIRLLVSFQTSENLIQMVNMYSIIFLPMLIII